MWEQAEAGYRQAQDPVGVVGSQIDRSQALTAEDRAPIFVSIANTLRDLGTRVGVRVGEASRREASRREASPLENRDRTGRLQPPSNPPLTCPTQPTGSLQAGAYYQLAIACYQQAGTLTADLNLLSLQVDISQWHRHEAAALSINSNWYQFNQSDLIKKIANRLPSLPYTYAESNQRINFARSLVLANSPQWEAATELLNTVITKSRLLGKISLNLNMAGMMSPLPNFTIG